MPKEHSWEDLVLMIGKKKSAIAKQSGDNFSQATTHSLGQVYSTISPNQLPIPENFDSPVSEWDLEYFRTRFRNRVYSSVLGTYQSAFDEGRITKAALARRLKKDPAQITRLFAGSSNWTLDTVSDLLIAIGAELEPEIIFICERGKSNYSHPAIDELADVEYSQTETNRQMPKIRLSKLNEVAA